jgi:hypothetical protein
MDRERMERKTYRLSIVIFVMTMIVILSNFSFSSGPGPNNKNFSVDTKINITGSPPTVQRVILLSPITLTAGTITNITCNATIRDYNGFADLNTVNATFFFNGTSEFAAENNNTNYFNSSCSVIAGQASGVFANYTCTFPINFYANNGSWSCEVRANDSSGFRGNNSNTTSINALYALNVTPLLDYGNVSAGEIAGNATANITNLGNMNINISVKGYARTINDGLAFVCDQGQLTVDVERFSANDTADFAVKQTLTNALQRVSGLTVNRSVNATQVTNVTYWEVYADPAQPAFGNCTGTVIFQAEAT